MTRPKPPTPAKVTVDALTRLIDSLQRGIDAALDQKLYQNIGPMADSARAAILARLDVAREHKVEIGGKEGEE